MAAASAKTKAKKKSAASPRKKARPAPRKATGRKVAAKKVTKKKAPPRRKAAATPTRRRGPTIPHREAGTPGFGISPVYLAALKEYEKGMAMLQKRHFDQAKAQFLKLIDKYPTVKDLFDRAQIYINLCDKQNETEPTLSGFDDYYYHGVYLCNRREYGPALEHLEKARSLQPQSQKVHYSISSVLCLQGDRERAIEFLRKAVEMDEVNRVYARNDPDFQSLHGDPEFNQLVGLGDG